jgi:hypothetical protein
MYINNEDGFYVSLANGDYRFSFATDGNTYLPNNVIIDNGGTDANIDSTGNINVISNGNVSTFDTTGNLYVSGSGVFNGQNLYVGEGSNSLTQFNAATLVISANDTAYIQAVVTNVSDIGSADWVAYGHHGADTGGWVDMGFTSASFSDANYTITGPGDGYVFAHGYAPGQAPTDGNGNLVLATGDQGNVKDIVFATGGFLSSNEFMRISHANGNLEFYNHGNITGAGNVTANGFINGAASPTANSAIGYYTIDNSGQSVALAAAGYIDIPNFSGMLIVNDIYSGVVAVWICGGANAVQMSITSTSIHPTLGTMAQQGSGYRWTNNGYTGPFTFTNIRTRTGA